MTANGVRVLLMLSLGLGIAGCGKKAPKVIKPLPAQVTGTVWLDDVPVTSGVVTFIPALPEANGGRPGLAALDTSGHYRVGNTNPAKPPGLHPGRYTVTIMSLSANADGAISQQLPEIYRDYRRSPLHANVVAGDNRFDFRLLSTPTLAERANVTIRAR